jgi:hypothetical protein
VLVIELELHGHADNSSPPIAAVTELAGEAR